MEVSVRSDGINSTKHNSMIDTIMDLILVFVILHAAFPPVTGTFPSELTEMIGACLWGVLASFTRPSFFYRMPPHRYIWLLLVLYTSIVPRFFGNGIIANRFLAFGVFPFYYIAHDYNREFGGKHRNWRIIQIVIPFIVISCVVTIFRLRTDPWISRVINTSAENSNEIMRSGVGGYDFIYMLPFLSIVLTGSSIRTLVKNKNVTISLFLQLTVLFCFVYTILLSNFLTAIGIYIGFSLLMFMWSKVSWIYKIFVIFLLCLGVVLILVMLNDYIALLFGEGKTVQRILEMMSGGNVSSISSDRQSVMDISLDAIRKNPVQGLIFHKIEINGGWMQGFGQHSQFLDSIALFGSIVGFVQIYCMIQPIWVRVRKTWDFGLIDPAMLGAAIIFLTIDNVTCSVGFAVYFFYPSVRDYLVQEYS